ncbi:MAG TPA: hypothetical protein ENN64_00090 [bacterium]|nr:hypothetical protein [bacterium]
MKYEIIPTGEDHHLHPNTVLFKVRRGSTNFEIVGCSIGGGNIEIHQINGVKIKPLDGKKDVFAIISDTKKDVSRLLNRLSCKYSSIDEYKTLNDKYLYLVHEIKSNSKGIALPGYKYRLISSIL